MVDTYGFILTYGNVLSYLLNARKRMYSEVSIKNVTKLINCITQQLKRYCLEFDETINGKTYRERVSRSVDEMTYLCIKMLK